MSQKPVRVQEEDSFYKITAGEWSLEINQSEAQSVVVDDGYVFVEHSDGVYSAHSPAEGVASQGDTLEEARRNLAEAVVLTREGDKF